MKNRSITAAAIFTVICAILLYSILVWGNYLIKNNYISNQIQIEGLDTMSNSLVNTNMGNDNSNGNGTGINRESLSTNHTVNLPINTTSSCKNVCGPLARCSITGEQCSTDVDCFGCQPIINNVSTSSTVQIGNNNIRGQNDAGKLTNAETPTYSTLTTDIGSRAQLFNKQTISAPKYFQGVNIWREKYDVAKSLYSSRYASADANQYIKYPKRETLSGEFEDDGPLAANAYLH